MRLLNLAREKLGKLGLHLPLQSTPRQLSATLENSGVMAVPQRLAWSDWLLRLESVRYAEIPQPSVASYRRQLATLRSELNRL